MTFDLMTERHVAITADNEAAARRVAELSLGGHSTREGYAKGAGHYRMQIYPGTIIACRETKESAGGNRGK